MKIRYTGPKEQKRVQFSSGEFVYVFNGDEPQEITNVEHLRFFLHEDRYGLFEKVEDEVTDDGPDFEKMNKADLLAYCHDNGIEVVDGAKKDEILQAIENHQKAEV